MTRFSLKGLAARRLRTALTALAIVLGVAMVSAAYTLTDTFRTAADSLSSSAYDGTDAVVTSKTRSRPTTPTSPARCRRCPRRRSRNPEAAGVGARHRRHHRRRPKLIGKDGKPIGAGPYFGVGFDSRRAGAERAHPVQARLRPLGHRPRPGRHRQGHRAEEALRGRRPGSRSRPRAPRGPSRSRASPGSATSSRSAPPRPRSSTCGPRSRCSPSAALRRHPRHGRAGHVARAAAQRPRAACPPAGRSRSAQEQDRFTLDGLKSFLSIIKTASCSPSGSSRSSSARSRSTTRCRSRSPSAPVSWRCCRTIGASRRQVMRLGHARGLRHRRCIGSVVGIAAGFGLAHGLQRAPSSFGLDLPQTAMGLAVRTVIIAGLVGIVGHGAGGPRPGAARHARLPGDRAARGRARAARAASAAAATVDRRRRCRSLGLRRRSATACSRGGLDASDRLHLAGARLPRCCSSAWRCSPPGSPGRWPRSSAARRESSAAWPAGSRGATRCATPSAPRSTAAALMIGIALVTFVAVLGPGLTQAATGDLKDSLRASAVVSGRDG